jgi:superfamily II DNA or RNA helicase
MSKIKEIDLGDIYVKIKKYDKRTKYTKIGSTKNFYYRMQTYKTDELFFDNESLDVWKFKIIESIYDCYELDEIIRKSSIEFDKPYKYLYGSGGIEHYQFDDIENLKIFFDKMKIIYEFEKVDVDKICNYYENNSQKDMRKNIYNEDCEREDKKQKISKNDIDNIKKSYFENNQVIIQPLDYQIEVLKNLEQIYKKQDKFKLIWSCGLGKSLLSIFITKFFQYKKIVIGVPSIYLQKQFLNEILRVFPNEHNVLCIGSYKNFTTDKNKITEHYKKHEKVQEPIFIITTYCSCHLMVDDYDYEFDFKIGDEAHHLVGIENNETNNYKLFHNVKSKKSLFMTATEKTMDNKNNKVIYSMDDETIFGNYIDVKSVKWAIDNKKITDYDLLILSNTEKEIDNIIKELRLKIEDKNLFLSAFMTLKAMSEYKKLTHVLVCCNRNESADIISNYVSLLLEKNIFDIKEKYFYNNSLHTGKKINIDLSDKDSEIHKFKQSRYGIISSVYIFGEGFDLPKLNGVVFAENMISDIRIVQTALRPNRLDKNDAEKKAFIIIPYMEANSILEDEGSYERVRMIISKLRNVDESIEQKIKIQKVVKVESPNQSSKKIQYNFDFEDENEELHKIRLRLIYSHTLGSKNTEEQDEYNYVREINREMKIKSKEMYVDKKIISNHKHYVEKAEEYFKLKGVWDNWYDFLGYDTSKFLKTKSEWVNFCKEKNVQTLEDYEEISEKYECLPKNPTDYYREFSNIQNELGLYKKRR